MRKLKKLTIGLTSGALLFLGANAAVAFDLGGIGGLLETASPVIGKYTGVDVQRYTGYLNSARTVLASLKSGSISNIASAVGSINRSLGDAGVTIPSKLAQDVLNSVTDRYSTTPQRGVLGVGQVSAGDRAVRHAENVAHRVHVEATIGEDGQKQIAQSVVNSAALSKQSAEIAQKCNASTVSQEILKCISAQQTLISVGLSQAHDEAVQGRIDGATQTEILAGMKEAIDGDRTTQDLERSAIASHSASSSGVLAGLASPQGHSGEFTRTNPQRTY